jgi:UDP-glucose 4-epimerase
MKILVTGGAGFIGSHLCEKLKQDRNNKVYSLDNYSTGTEKNHIKGVTYIKGETKNISKIIHFIPDIVYHLGEYARVEQSFDDIEKVWEYNKDGIFSVLQFCRKHACKIVYAGSSTKFSDGGMGRSQSPYAWTKASNTELVENYGEWYGVQYAIVYFYNVYGGREISSGKYATLIALFKGLYKANKALTVVSPGTQLRNFTYIDDIVSGIIVVGKDGTGDNFGIGCSQAHSILEVANMFQSRIELLPSRKGNRMDGVVICDKTKALGWQEQHSLKHHIHDFINKTNKLEK